MEISQIPQADLLDILFEGRNKSYGAYDLRKFYNQRLAKAILITLSLCLLLIFGYILAGKLDSRPMTGLVAGPTVILDQAPPVEKTVVPPPPPLHTALPPQVATLNDASVRIVTDNQVNPDERPHTADELNNARLGTTDRTGTPDDNSGPVGPPDGSGTGLLPTPPQNDNTDDSTLITVQIQSSYQGGPQAWRRFLERNFRTPREALEKGINGTVIVQFIVDKKGNVSDVQAISGPEELKEEAVRVIKKSGAWNPAIQNGRQVNSYKKQPIVVTVMGPED
jgi:protein TonB